MITTSINREYRQRWLAVALVITAMGAWFVYDGAIGYPKKNEKHAGFVAALEALEKEKAEAGEAMPAAKDWLKEDDDGGGRYIDRFARAAGVELSTSQVEEIKGTRDRVADTHRMEPDTKKAAEIIAVYEKNLLVNLKKPPYDKASINTQFGFAVFAFLFAAILVGLVAKRMRVTFTADERGLSRNNERFAYADLTGIDWAKWHEKGIARLNFNGTVWTLDAWYHAGIDEIIALILEKRRDFTMPEKPAKD